MPDILHMNSETVIKNSGIQIQLLLRSLQSRNFRLFFAGQGISLIGTWMQQVAMSWLVYRMTDSAFLLGVVGFAGQVPTFLLAPVAGVAADRWDKRRLLIYTQTLSMLQAALLAFVVLTGFVRVWQIIGLSLFLGLINTFDIPARQSFFVEIVDKREDLGNAIALNSSMFNSARLIGPSIAGILVARFGEGTCFILNALSYLAVLLALAAMRIQPREPRLVEHHILHELREGFGYAFGCAPIRSILLLMTLVSLMGMSYIIVLPVFAKDILHGSAGIYGFLMAAAGCGALLSTIYLASRNSVLGLGKLSARATILFGAGLVLFSFSNSTSLSIIILFFVGFGAMALVASSNTILQTVVEDDKRGRVMSLFTMSFIGMAPFGSLIAGAITNTMGVRMALMIGGVSCLAGGILYTLALPKIRAQIRPIYVKKGIITEVAAGMQSAAEPSAPPEKR
jgi:MFS family permease